MAIGLVNVACHKCSKPLFAFRQTAAQRAKGESIMESYGASVRFPQETPEKALAICPTCGAETPFDRKLMPA